MRIKSCMFMIMIGFGVATLGAACGGESNNNVEQLTGSVEIDGSSTVFLVSEAVAEEFSKVEPKVRVNVAISGTGGGFKRFVSGETDISNASRPLKQSESAKALDNGVEYLQLKVAVDGLSVIVNPDNNFVDCLSIEELHAIWNPESEIISWNQLRPEWPDKPLKLYGPDTDSGTFDYFTEQVMGEAQVSRSDYVASANDNVLVTGVAGDVHSLGYFAYAYYIANTEMVKAVAIDGGKGCVLPNQQNISSGKYEPLSRPLFIYVNKASLKRPEVQSFVKFYMENARGLSEEVGYLSLSTEEYQANILKIG